MPFKSQDFPNIQKQDSRKLKIMSCVTISFQFCFSKILFPTLPRSGRDSMEEKLKILINEEIKRITKKLFVFHWDTKLDPKYRKKKPTLNQNRSQTLIYSNSQQRSFDPTNLKLFWILANQNSLAEIWVVGVILWRLKSCKRTFKK